MAGVFGCSVGAVYQGQPNNRRYVAALGLFAVHVSGSAALRLLIKNLPGTLRETTSRYRHADPRACGG
jgi:hypothetical protein